MEGKSELGESWWQVSRESDGERVNVHLHCL